MHSPPASSRGSTASTEIGITVTVTPSSLRLAPGQSKAFKVTFATGTAALNAFTAGQLTWFDGKHRDRDYRDRHAVLAAPRTGPEQGVQGDVRHRHGGAECIHRRPAHVVRRQAPRSGLP